MGENSVYIVYKYAFSLKYRRTIPGRRAYESGGAVDTSVRCPENGACESLKGPIALAIDVVFRFFHFFQIMFVAALYKVYVIWTFCCTGNKASIKVYQWFY